MVHPTLLHSLHVSAMSQFLNNDTLQTPMKDGMAEEPQFLQDVTPQSKSKYYAILADKFSSKSVVQSRLDEWASQQSNAVKMAYKKFKCNANDAVAKLIDKLDDTECSSASKSAIHQINSINAKKDTSLAEGAELYNQIVNSLTENEQREVHDFFSNL